MDDVLPQRLSKPKIELLTMCSFVARSLENNKSQPALSLPEK
jgi:hypothetical protein